MFLIGYHELLLNHDAFGTVPVVYSRYMDDCVAIFETKGLALDFMCLLNRMHLALTLTMEEENDYRLPSLGVMVIRSGTSCLTTTLYEPQQA